MPEQIGRYQPGRVLGRGAMGVVYEAWDPVEGRTVALKTLHIPPLGEGISAEEYSRFKREHEATLSLDHPGIVEVYDWGETDGSAYIAMELVPGQSLRSLLENQQRLRPEMAIKIVRELLDALAYSHRRGVIHRDIKPTNIMLTPSGAVKVIDFGIARIESSELTQVGTQLGAPAYMSPEQHLGDPVDPRTDIYSVGVVLYQLLTGERPFQGGERAIRHQVLQTTPPPPSEISVTAPRALDAVVARAMARRPEDRYPSAEAFSAALAAAMRTDADDTLIQTRREPPPVPAAPIERPPAPPALPPRPPARHWPAMLFGGVAVVLLIAAGTAWYLLEAKPQPEPIVAAVTPKPGGGATDPTPPSPGSANTAARSLSPTRPAAEAPQVPNAPRVADAPRPAPPPTLPRFAETSVPTPQPTPTPSPSLPRVADTPVLVPQPAPSPPPEAAASSAPPRPSLPRFADAPSPLPVPAPEPAPTPAPVPPPLQPQAGATLSPAPAPNPGTLAPPAPEPAPVPSEPLAQPPGRTTEAFNQPNPIPPIIPESGVSQPPAADTSPPSAPMPPYRPTPSPPPSRPSAPVANEAPANARLLTLARTLRTVNCAAIDLKLTADQRIAASGLARRGASEQDVRKTIQVAEGLVAGPPVDWRTTTFDGPYCGVVNFIRDLQADGPDPGDFAFFLRENRPSYRNWEKFTPALNGPPFAAYLQVEYFQSDGKVAQLFPASQPNRLFPAGASISLDTQEVGPPFGSDMILAVMSSERLPLRPTQERAETYLAAVRSAIDAARLRGAKIVARAIPVQTRP